MCRTVIRPAPGWIESVSYTFARIGEVAQKESVTSFLARLFGRATEPQPEPDPNPGGAGAAALEELLEGDVLDPGARHHAVTAWLRLTDPELIQAREQIRMFALEDQVMRALDRSGAGTYDTNDLERGFFRMHCYGPDADRLVDVIQPILATAPPGSYLAKRPGPRGTSEERVELT